MSDELLDRARALLDGPKRYPQVPDFLLGPVYADRYLDHLVAIRFESLNSKDAMAMQLALRDAIIGELVSEVERLRIAELEAQRSDPVAFVSKEDGSITARKKLPLWTELYTAPPAPSVPDGWKPMPLEPTDEMIDAACDACPSYRAAMMQAYDAMLAAAPKVNR
jgi:hypothetical protein